MKRASSARVDVGFTMLHISIYGKLFSGDWMVKFLEFLRTRPGYAGKALERQNGEEYISYKILSRQDFEIARMSTKCMKLS